MDSRNLEALMKIVQKKAPSALIEIFGASGKFAFEVGAVLDISPMSALLLFLFLAGYCLRDCCFFSPWATLQVSNLNLVLEYVGNLTPELEAAFNHLLLAVFEHLRDIQERMEMPDVCRNLTLMLPKHEKIDGFLKDMIHQNFCVNYGVFGACGQYGPLLCGAMGKVKESRSYDLLNSMICGRFSGRMRVDDGEPTSGISFVNGLFLSDAEEFVKMRIDKRLYSYSLKCFDEHKLPVLDLECVWQDGERENVLGESGKRRVESFFSSLASVLFNEYMGIRRKVRSNGCSFQYKARETGNEILRGFCNRLRNRQSLKEAYLDLIGSENGNNVGRVNDEGRESLFLETVFWKRAMFVVLSLSVRFKKLRDWVSSMESDGFVSVDDVDDVIGDCFIGHAIRFVELVAYRHAAVVGYELMSLGKRQVRLLPVECEKQKKAMAEFRECVKSLMLYPGFAVPVNLTLDLKTCKGRSAEEKVYSICRNMQIVTCLPGGDICDSVGFLVDVIHRGVGVQLLLKTNPLCLSSVGWDKTMVDKQQYVDAFLEEPWYNLRTGSKLFPAVLSILGIDGDARKDRRLSKVERAGKLDEVKMFYLSVFEKKLDRFVEFEDQVDLNIRNRETGKQVTGGERGVVSGIPFSESSCLTIAKFLGRDASNISYFKTVVGDPRVDRFASMTRSLIPPEKSAAQSFGSRFDSGRNTVSNLTAVANCLDLKPIGGPVKPVRLMDLYKGEQKYFDQKTWMAREERAKSKVSLASSDNPLKSFEDYAENVMVCFDRTSKLDLETLLELERIECMENKEMSVRDGVSDQCEQFFIRSERASSGFLDWKKNSKDISVFREQLKPKDVLGGLEKEQHFPVSSNLGFRAEDMFGRYSGSYPVGDAVGGTGVVSDVGGENLMDMLGEGARRRAQLVGCVPSDNLVCGSKQNVPSEGGDDFGNFGIGSVVLNERDACRIVLAVLGPVLPVFDGGFWNKFWTVNGGPSRIGSMCAVDRGGVRYLFGPSGLAIVVIDGGKEKRLYGASTESFSDSLTRRCLGQLFKDLCRWWNGGDACSIDNFGLVYSPGLKKKAAAFVAKFVDGGRPAVYPSRLNEELKVEDGDGNCSEGCEKKSVVPKKTLSEAVSRGLPSGQDSRRLFDVHNIDNFLEKVQSGLTSDSRDLDLSKDVLVLRSTSDWASLVEFLSAFVSLCRDFDENLFRMSDFLVLEEGQKGGCDLEVFRAGKCNSQGEDSVVLCQSVGGKVKIFDCFGVGKDVGLLKKIGAVFDNVANKDGWCWLEWVRVQEGASVWEKMTLLLSYLCNLVIGDAVPSFMASTVFRSDVCLMYLNCSLRDGCLYEIPVYNLRCVPMECSKKYSGTDITQAYVK